MSFKNCFKGKRLRKMRCFFTLLVCFIIIGLCGCFNDVVKADNLSPERDLRQIVVENGDTLWCLVKTYYDYQGDIRDAIHEVKQINGLKSSQIHCGQIILIPRE